ncbi:MAG: glutamate--tRNA ligase [Candidatus Moraniibacteriota bacterium]
MTDSSKKIRVRFAPSPTGYLHIGGLRTALYNYLFAKQKGGDFLLRIEDTDQKRFVEGAVENLINALAQMGLTWDEGVQINDQKSITNNQQTQNSTTYNGVIEIGDCGPYVQSERLELYKKYAEQLVATGKAYYCFCEPARLEKMREKQQTEKLPPMYDRYCLTELTPEEINEKLKNNCPVTIRLKVPKDEVVEFEDLVRGKVSFATSTIDDQVLLKSDGFPTYHLANVVDDHLMGITTVIRGEEWLPSTPKHILLYRAFDWEIPAFAHIPLLLNPDKSKLSKRQGDVAVEDYLQKGYLKEALLNFVALLGWNPGEGSVQEIFSLDELVEKFDLKKVHKAGAVFDLKKLDWLNAQYLKKLSIEELFEKAQPFFEQKEFYKEWNAKHTCLSGLPVRQAGRQAAWSNEDKKEYMKKVLTIEQDRLANFSQVGEENKFFFEEITYEKSLLFWKEMTDEQLRTSLQKLYSVLSEINQETWTRQALEAKLVVASGDNKGQLLWPLRACLTGAQKSPSPFDCAWVLGKEESLKRIEKALDLIG